MFLEQTFDKANRPRVLRRNLARLREAVATQKWKRAAKEKADAVAALSLQRQMFRSLRHGVAVAAACRKQRARADAFAVGMLVKRGWTHLRDHEAEKKVMLIGCDDLCVMIMTVCCIIITHPFHVLYCVLRVFASHSDKKYTK